MRAAVSFLCLGVLTLGLPAQRIDRHNRTQTIKLTERAGVARTRAPVELTVRFETYALKKADDVRLFRVKGATRTPVPCQVMEVTSRDGTDSFARIPQTFVRLFFQADVPANGS